MRKLSLKQKTYKTLRLFAICGVACRTFPCRSGKAIVIRRPTWGAELVAVADRDDVRALAFSLD